MIDPSFAPARARLSRSMDHFHRQLEVYRKARAETIRLHSGSAEYASAVGGAKKPWGNLIQLSTISHVVTLAFGEPEFTCIANAPEGDHVAPRLEAFLNRYSNLINLGDIARAVALDSQFGYGIVKVSNGMLPAGARRLTGQSVGPMCWRVSQDYFGFDGHATNWDDVSFMWDMITIPLDAAKQFMPFLQYNPEGAAQLGEFGMRGINEDGRLHSSAGRDYSAMQMTRLINVYLPHAGVIATWPSNDAVFNGVEGEPLLVEPYNGHHTGPFGILSHLDIPDNLVPAAQVESVKNYHYLFNELADITAHQATSAKFNPVYEIGAQRDMERLKNAADREEVGVSNIQKIGNYEKPGPTPSQTAYMQAAFALFKELSGNLDDQLGLSPTAGTARQSAMIRQSTTAIGAEKGRRMNRLMELVARKLAHLVLNSETLRLPIRMPLPQSSLMQDMSWLPLAEMPRNPDADDYLISIVVDSMHYRGTEERLAQLNEATGQIIQAAQAVAMGVPLDLKKVVETQAKYRRLPELKEWFSAMLPEHMQAKEQASGIRIQRQGVGEYTRTNISERTNDGALTTLLSQQPSAGGPQGV